MELKKLQQLMEAVRTGDHTTVQIMLNDLTVDPKSNHSEALKVAAEFGQTKCLQMLIPVSNPAAGLGHAMNAAIKNNHIECVNLLLPVYNIQQFSSAYLQLACELQNKDIVDMLYPLSEPGVALIGLESRAHIKGVQFLKDKMMHEKARKEKSEILDNINIIQPTKPTRKI